MSSPLDPVSRRIGATLLGKFHVVRLIGQGAHGAVYEVVHLQTKHRRALKVLHADRTDAEVARLVREAGVAGRVRSPRLAETLDVGRLDDGAPYLLLELLDGETLRAALDPGRPLPTDRAVTIAREVCEGLASLHEAGLIHRDIKPENIFLCASPPGYTRLLDLGVVAPLSGDSLGDLTEEGHTTGTPAYMAPEQLDGVDAVDARADLYALGVVLHEMLAGDRPTTARQLLPLLLQIKRGDLVPLATVRPDLDPGLLAVVSRALSLDPARRFASAREMRDALAPFSTSPDDPLAGSDLAARYRFVRRLKTGGMGQVHEVLQRDTQRPRALKLMRPELLSSAAQRERFLREATVAAGVQSAHLVEVIDAGIDPRSQQPYLVMELLRGQDLAELIALRGPLSPRQALPLLLQAATALDRTHAAGVVHRDIKPQNLFVSTRDDGSSWLKILDFGLAFAAGDSATTTSGTPLYAAPEQLRGEATDGRADLYALAHVAYAMLVGRPYHADAARAGLMAVLSEIASGTREPPSRRAARQGILLPTAFDDWFSRATDPDPARRFSSGTSMIEALSASLSPRLPRWPLLLAAPLLGGALWLTSLQPRPSPVSSPPRPSPEIPDRGAESTASASASTSSPPGPSPSSSPPRPSPEIPERGAESTASASASTSASPSTSTSASPSTSPSSSALASAPEAATETAQPGRRPPSPVFPERGGGVRTPERGGGVRTPHRPDGGKTTPLTETIH